jgi:RNA polymerase sigma factor (sigma-70 family)
MATSQMSEIIQHLRRAVVLPDGAGLTDGQLLEDYISRRDEAALAALVRRHAPMVWGVCRRVLRNYHDAEDAFQATFLVLVRRAASIASKELLANWLYGVAHQTALKARATAAKRCAREKQVTEMPEPAVAQQDHWRDLQPVLDEELSRLPDKYRAVIVLCDLGGKTRKEAARQLGVPEGTVASRLATARTMLAKRLARHGLAVSGGALAAVVSQQAASACVPPSVVSSTIKAVTLVAAGQAAAAGVIPAKVAALTKGVLKAMLVSKLKIATPVLLLVAVAITGVGAGGLFHQTQAAPIPQATDKKEKQGEKQTVVIDGVIDGKKFQPDPKSVEPGAEAAVKLLAASTSVDFYGAPQNRPIGKEDWQREVVAGIENKRAHLRIQFGKPKQIEGPLNSEKGKYSVSEVVFFFFEPGAPQGGPIENRPVCFWGRDGDKYYFGNKIEGYEELVKWLGKAQER